MAMLLLTVFLIAIAVAAPRYGVDTRAPLGPARWATPRSDLAALRHWWRGRRPA